MVNQRSESPINAVQQARSTSSLWGTQWTSLPDTLVNRDLASKILSLNPSVKKLLTIPVSDLFRGASTQAFFQHHTWSDHWQHLLYLAPWLLSLMTSQNETAPSPPANVGTSSLIHSPGGPRSA